MFKRILCMLSLLCCMLCAGATAKYVTVELNSGIKYSFLLKSKPVITYSKGDLIVNGNESTSYALSGVLNYHFSEDSETGVETLDANIMRIVSLDESTLQILNAPVSTKVALVAANGVMVLTTETDFNGTATVSLPSQKGIYVLSVGNQSFKVIRK